MCELARKVVRDGGRYLPKCASSEELLSTAQSLLKVGELGVGIGLTGPDGPAGAGRVMSKTLTVPTDIDIVQSDMPFELPANSDVVVILVDASQPNWLLGMPNMGSPRRKEGSIGGRSLLSVVAEGPVEALAKRAARQVGAHNVYIGVSGCGAEAAGTPEDRAATEATLADSSGLKAEQVACFGLPGGALFGGGLGGGTVGGRKRLLSWCTSIQDSALSLQQQRAEQIRGQLHKAARVVRFKAARVVRFWAELRGPRSTTSWIVTRILSAAVEGIPALGMLGAEQLAAQYVREHGEASRETVQRLTKSQAGLSFTTFFLTGLGGIFTAPVSLPMSLAASILVRLRLCLALAAMGGHKAVEPNVVASALACVTQCRRGVELAKLALQPELPPAGTAEEEGEVQWAERRAVAGAVNAAEAVRRQALLEGVPPAQAASAAQAAFEGALPMEIVERAGQLALEAGPGGGLLGHAAEAVPVFGGMVSGGVDGAVLHQAMRAAVEAFLPRVQMSFDASEGERSRAGSASPAAAESGDTPLTSHAVRFEDLSLDDSTCDGEDEGGVLIAAAEHIASEDNSPASVCSASSWGSVAKQMAGSWVPQLWSTACPEPCARAAQP